MVVDTQIQRCFGFPNVEGRAKPTVEHVHCHAGIAHEVAAGGVYKASGWACEGGTMCQDRACEAVVLFTLYSLIDGWRRWWNGRVVADQLVSEVWWAPEHQPRWFRV